MTTGIFHTPDPQNEPVTSYAPGTPSDLASKVSKKMSEVIETHRCQRQRSSRQNQLTMPSNHGLFAIAHLATPAVQQAIESSKQATVGKPARRSSSDLLKAADLLAGPGEIDQCNNNARTGQNRKVEQTLLVSLTFGNSMRATQKRFC